MAAVKSRFRPILLSLLICILLLGLYQILVGGGILASSDGINERQSNIIRSQRYVYQNNHELKMILVGSSLTANIKAKDIGSNVTNLGMAGGATQTGLEIVKRKKSNPSILLVEVNETIDRKLDTEMIESLYDPLLYFIRLAFPMFREEYRPVSLLVSWIKSRSKQYSSPKDEQQEKERVRNSEISQKARKSRIQEGMKPLSEKQEKVIREQGEYIKNQIEKLKQDGWRVILFDVPGEERVQTTTMHKQVRQMMREIFPTDIFEWLPEPPSRDWVTRDGVHLVSADAKDYALFLRDKLLSSTF